MLLKYFYDRTLAQASYLIGDTHTGEALVIDPARDIEPYLEAARAEGLRITHVTETHIHADFVGGLRELAAAGAVPYVSGMGGTDWQYGDAEALGAVRLTDGDRIMVGAVQVQALHTPGHTPEHLVFLFTDTETGDQPMGMFTGDCLFIGDVGRPDLLETAAGIADSKEQGARDMFASLARLRALPDWLLVLPGHGAGSACGKALSAVPTSTLGYELRFNPAFQFSDEAAFSQWLLAGQPETPRYFARMKQVNRDGGALLASLNAPEPLDVFIAPEAAAKARSDDMLVIDTRPPMDYNSGHLPGAMNIPAGEKFATYAGWFVRYDQPLYLVAYGSTTDELVHQLRSIGVDLIAGWFTPEAMRDQSEVMATIEPAAASAQLDGGAQLLDVRAQREVDEVHLSNACHILYGQLPDHIAALDRSAPLLVYCASGVRSQIGASYLRAAGFENVATVRGGIDAWRKAGLPVVEGDTT